MSDEETRARAFREQQAQQAAAKRAANARLAGSPAAYRNVVDAWEAVRLWLVERRGR